MGSKPRGADDGADGLEITFREVDAATWPDFERLFEGRGGPKNCWCMVWRAHGTEAKRIDGPHRKAAMKRRIDEDVPVGILAYLASEPIAWCSIAPRETYRDLGGPPEPAAPGSVWSLVCFFITRGARRQGLARRLLREAIDVAARHGADVIEAYPVDPDSPSYRFGGFLSLYSDAGFEEVGRAGKRRHVVRHRVRPGAEGVAGGE